MAQKRIDWARLSEEQNDEITRAKREFAEAVKAAPPVKQILQAIEWVLRRLAILK